MTGLVFAILAHDARPCLEDQLANLRAFAPDARVVVFNGGTDRDLTRNLDVLTCPYSRPLSHHRVGSFHGLVMQWLVEQDLDRDLLVTLDSDMLLLRAGVEERLTRALDGCGYAGAHFGEVLPGTSWRPGRRFLRKWPGPWQELFGLPHPYRAFNPGQVFSREYVRGFAAWPHRDRLLQALERTRLDALDEIVWPTLAVAMGVGTVEHPSGRSLQLRRHSPQEIGSYLSDPDLLLLHRVGMDVDAPERTLLRRVAARERVDVSALPFTYSTSVASPTRTRRAAAVVKDWLQAAAPASRRR